MNRPILKLTLFAICVVVACTLVATLRGQGQNESIERGTQSRAENGKPLAFYAAPESTDPSERALRQARSSRYNKRYPRRFDELQRDTKSRLVMSDWAVGLPALPTAQSDAVVLGEITSATGHLSTDKTGAYSEFTVLITEILKNDGRLSNESIVVEREGALVRLPDGRTIDCGFAGQGMPQLGRRYVLFLKFDKEVEDYILVTGYELDQGRIVPLDNVGTFTEYKGAEEVTFLNAVRAAVIHPPQAPKAGGKDQ